MNLLFYLFMNLSDSTSITTVMEIRPDSVFYYCNGYRTEKIEAKRNQVYLTKNATIYIKGLWVTIECERIKETWKIRHQKER